MSVAVFGSINCDVIAYLPRLPQTGETLHGPSYRIGLGGKGANQAVAARRLGSDVRFICRIGDDMFGRTALDEIESYGVDTALIRRDERGQTGLAIINVGASGENTISLIGGSNLEMDRTDIERSGAALDASGVLLLQLEVPFAASLAAARQVRAHGGIVILDPAPAPAMPFSAADLELVDILTPNENETAALIGWHPLDADEGLKAARELRKQGVRTAIVKLGGKGVVVSGPAAEEFIAPYAVTPVDTVAAGDCFNGGLAHALEQGEGLVDAVRFAAACGALSTTKRGAAAAAPTLADVKAFMVAAGT